MPDKPLTVLTYAASASLAAVALVYLFNPSYLLDAATVTPGARRFQHAAGRGRAVGLANPANDCFINSVLQALAGLAVLRAYLARELELRDADADGTIYAYRPDGEQERAKSTVRRRKRRRADGDEPGSNDEMEEDEVEMGAEQQGEEEDDEGGDESAAATTTTADGVPGAGLEEEWRRRAQQRKTRSLLDAEVTRGLREMLEQLSDRSSSSQQQQQQPRRKIISAAPFVQVLESAFATRVNRNQQDAQELLQVVAERMAEEYAAGKSARDKARERGVDTRKRKRAATMRMLEEKRERTATPEPPVVVVAPATLPATAVNGEIVKNGGEGEKEGEEREKEEEKEKGKNLELEDEEQEFPLQGQTKHQIECQHCQFIPSSKPTDFIMLTLSVPPKSSATLDECLDQFSKPEFIDDYKCDRCRVQHAIETFEATAAAARTTDAERARLRTDVFKLKLALDRDPEQIPDDVRLPDSRLAPARRIARSVRITAFPRVLVVHLSRSSFDLGAASTKNTGRVAFPEILPLGSLVDRRSYRLHGLVTHKGTHHSGHYETFRRVHSAPLSVADVIDLEDSVAGGGGGSSSSNAATRSSTPRPGGTAATAAVTTGRVSSPTPEPRASTAGRSDSDVEAEALDGMLPNSSSTATTTTTTHLSPLSSRPSSSTTAAPTTTTTGSAKHLANSRTSASSSSMTLPTPESVLQEAATAATATTSGGVEGRSSNSNDNTNNGGEDAAAATPERAPSRQRMRDRFEEAKERKREKRARRVVAHENSRWWRISDDRVRECRTVDVLGMQKEAYLLFYEMEQE